MNNILELENYAKLNNNLLIFIERAKTECVDLSMLDIIMDYSHLYDVTVDEIAEAINSDVYFKTLFESDCKSHLILKSEKRRDIEW